MLAQMRAQMRANTRATFSSISPALQNKSFCGFAVDRLFASNHQNYPLQLPPVISTEERGCTARRYRRGGGVRDRGANYGTGRTTGTLHFENSRPINRVLSGLACLGESPRCDGSCCGAPGRYDVRREKIALRGARR